MSNLRLGGASVNQIPFDWNHNKRTILEAIANAKKQEVDLLCLPELCITGYGCEDMFLSDWLPEKAFDTLLEVVPFCTEISVVLGLPIRLGKSLFNTACYIENAEIKGFYAKQILANDGVHYETRWFTPWPSGKETTFTKNGETYSIGDSVFERKGNKVSFEICEDAWHEDRRPGISHQQRGVDIILNPSASHFAFDKGNFRENLVTTSSKRFNCTYLYTNLLGNEAGRMVYDGDIIFAKKGKLVQRNPRLSFQDTNLVVVDIDPKSDQIEQPKLGLPIPEKEEEFVNASALALFDYLRKSRSRGFVLSLSGGADSGTCAVLVSEMVKRAVHELGTAGFVNKLKIDSLKADNSIAELTHKLLTCAYQGTENSSDVTYTAAKELADGIGATFYEWKIDSQVENNVSTIESAIGRPLTWETDDITLQNIQARSRSPIIWMLANINNALLLTTSNRSEGDVGYATMDGDTSGSIAPIAGVDKHFVRQWLLWAEENLNYPELSYINAQQPTAELRPQEMTQTDEKDLMPYDVMVQIERLGIKDKKSPDYIIEELKTIPHIAEYVKKFFRLWSRNQWKRERLAPSFHLDDFNVDPRTWCRFPILNSGIE
ncbi:MAG: NAD(+) synthase [Cyclobacteriaceae bacterium]